ncbi:MAG: precorrin-2 dehydrogenase/sirohydrochlorin ferrochelatase family protein [Armatimonadota bacterium]|jgi:precorrin-2 dehydrogenase/sirohydrochlorin ferrochelatase
MAHYSISINLSGRKCVVIGGGTVAQRKVETFLDFDANVSVVSPDLTPTLAELAGKGLIEHIDESFQPSHLDGAFLVVAATDDIEVNKSVSKEAESRGLLVNVVDVPELCSFFVPAMVRRGDIVISVSTSGKSPAMARRIRERLETQFGPEYGALATLLGKLRPEIKALYPDAADRNKAYRRILDSDVINLLAAGRTKEAVERARECIL